MGTVIFPQPPQRATQLNAMKDDMTKVGAAVLAGAAIFGATLPAQAITKSELNQLSYLQVKGTGLANRCSEVIGEDTITPKSGSRRCASNPRHGPLRRRSVRVERRRRNL